MEIISFPLHIGALCVLVALAAHRRNLFPFVLVSMYAAFFYLIYLSSSLNLISQLVLSSTSAAVLFTIAINSKRREYIKRFCGAMLFSILNQIFIFSFSFVDAGGAYVAAQASTAFITALLSLIEFYLLMRIIYGTRRGQPITTAIFSNFMDAISILAPSKKAIHSSIWQKREESNYNRTTEQG